MEKNLFFEVYPFIFLFDLLRYLLPAGTAFLIFWILFKKKWRHRFIQATFPNSSRLWSEFKYSMSTVVIFSLTGYGIFTANKMGYMKIYGAVADYGWVYFILSFIIMIVLHDFYFYWTHRAMHHKALFKYIHKVHHESTNPSPWAAYSFHPFEAVIQALVLPLILLVLPVHELTIFLFTSYMILQNVRGHLGYELLPPSFLKTKLFNWNLTTVHHNMHHKNFNCNYGLYFSWWDKWMNSNHSNYENTFEEVTSRLPENKNQNHIAKKITALIILMTLAGQASSQTPEGLWMTFDERTGNPIAHIKIESTSNGIEGRISKVIVQPHQGEDPLCTKCEGAKKGQKVVGMEFLWGFRKLNTEWKDGKILDPETGEIYESRLWLESEKTLKVRGYGGPLGLFYRTQMWQRTMNTVDARSPAGLWHTIDDHTNKIKSLVEIRIVNGELKAIVKEIYLLPHEGNDPVCTECKGDLNGKKIVGMKMLWGFAHQENKWIDGKILDPGNGNTYSSSMWLIDKNTLKVRGYLGPFYRSQIWKRVIL